MSEYTKLEKQRELMKEDEIDLIAIVRTLLKEKKVIIKTTLIFMVVGLLIALFSPKVYKSSTTILPQMASAKKGGGLSSIASLAGISLGSVGNGSEISPLLYEQIVGSTPFQKELLKTPLTIQGVSGKISFVDYYTNIYSPSLFSLFKKYTIGLPGLILKSIKGNKKNINVNRTRNQRAKRFL
jgi:hypothetical protein